jgi:cytoskeletal protein RodZ
MKTARTPQQRDRQFARVRRLTQTVFLAASTLSVLFVGYASAKSKPVTTFPVVTTPTGVIPVPTTTASNPSTPTTQPRPSTPTTQPRPGTPTTQPTTPTTTYVAPTPTTVYTPPKKPVTTTTVCYSTPSGHVTCR